MLGCSIATPFRYQGSNAAGSLTSRVYVTFDDGYSDQYDVARSILSRNGVKATFYIVYEWVGQTGFMTWNQIDTLMSEGHEIGSHSRNHPDDMNRLSATQLTNESATVKSLFWTQHNIETLTFAYPHSLGYDNSTVTSALVNAGYLYDRAAGAETWNRLTGTRPWVKSFACDYTDNPDYTFDEFKSYVNKAHGDEAVVLMYHHVADSGEYRVSVAEFTQEMDYLKTKGIVRNEGMSIVGGTLNKADTIPPLLGEVRDFQPTSLTALWHLQRQRGTRP